jgi:UDPglucose 6-dehydrogenase
MQSGLSRLAVCGLGKLGACIAAVLSSSDFSVVGLDIDMRTVVMLNQRRTPYKEPGLTGTLT